MKFYLVSFILLNTFIIVATIKLKHTHKKGVFVNNFADTCWDISFEDEHVLKATCQNAEGEEFPSELDLNNEISNANCKLQWDNDGGYMKTCDFCYLVQYSLHCQCFCDDGVLNQETVLSLWPIRNHQGKLEVKIDYIIIKER